MVSNYPVTDPANNLSRRSLLKMMGIGVGAAAASPLLAACGSGGGGATAGGDKTIVYAVQSFSHAALQPFLAEFKKLSGITVKLESGPASGQDLLTQLVPAFSSGSTPYDVVDADDPSCAAFIHGGFLSPLDDVLDKSFWNDLTPGMIDADKTWNTADGHTYRVHHNWEVGYYWTRSDELTALGLKAPTTWQELVDVGIKYKAKTGAYAFADAASKPGLTFVYLAYLTAQAGGDLYKFDAGTRQAFQFAHDLIYQHQLFPKEALTWTYDQLNTAYMQNKLMSMREWTFFQDVSKQNTAWYAPEKVEIVPPPAGPGGSKTWAGGWGIAVPKASKKTEQAKEFVKFMTSPEMAPRLAAASSFFVTARKSVFDKLGDTGIVKYMREYAEGNHITPRPFHPQAAQAESVIDDIGQSYLTGQMSLDDAMKQGAQRIASL